MLFVLFQKLFPHLCLSRHALSKFSFQPKNVKIEKQRKHFLKFKVLPSCKVWAQTDKKCRPHVARGDHEMLLMTQLARQKNENMLWRLNEVMRHPYQTFLRFSKTCELWSSKANRQLRFSLPSIILANLLGNKTLL